MTDKNWLEKHPLFFLWESEGNCNLQQKKNTEMNEWDWGLDELCRSTLRPRRLDANEEKMLKITISVFTFSVSRTIRWLVSTNVAYAYTSPTDWEPATTHTISITRIQIETIKLIRLRNNQVRWFTIERREKFVSYVVDLLLVAGTL